MRIIFAYHKLLTSLILNNKNNSLKLQIFLRAVIVSSSPCFCLLFLFVYYSFGMVLLSFLFTAVFFKSFIRSHCCILSELFNRANFTSYYHIHKILYFYSFPNYFFLELLFVHNCKVKVNT